MHTSDLAPHTDTPQADTTQPYLAPHTDTPQSDTTQPYMHRRSPGASAAGAAKSGD